MSNHDYPFNDVAKAADQLIMEGHTVYQKFTCEACGARQTFDVPNSFYTYGSCEECHHVTDIQKAGCNFMLVTGLTWTAEEIKAAHDAGMEEFARRGRKQ